MKGAPQIQSDGSRIDIFQERESPGVVSYFLKAENELTLLHSFAWSHCVLKSSLARTWLPRKLLQERLGQPRFLVVWWN